MKADYSNVTEARAAIEPFVGMWEMWDALNPELSGFKLMYSTSEIIDRNPPPGNYGQLLLPAVRMSGLEFRTLPVACTLNLPQNRPQ